MIGRLCGWLLRGLAFGGLYLLAQALGPVPLLLWLVIGLIGAAGEARR